jgi:hypothetical protein
VRYGNASLDRSASVSRSISVREAGPCTDSSVVPDVTSVTVRNSPGRVARLISGLDPAVDQVAGDDQELLRLQPGHGDVGDDPPGLVHPVACASLKIGVGVADQREARSSEPHVPPGRMSRRKLEGPSEGLRPVTLLFVYPVSIPARASSRLPDL